MSCRNRFFTLAGLVFLPVSLATPVLAQNLLANDGFETPPSQNLGMYMAGAIPPWRSAGVPLGSGPTDISANPHVHIQMDGPGGFPQGTWFPESDASAPGGGVPQHYVQPQGYAWQYVTPSCDGTLTFSVQAARLGGNNYDYGAGNAISIVPVSSEVDYLGASGYFPTTQTQDIIDLIAAHDSAKTGIVLPSGQPLENVWFPFSTQSAVQMGQTYAVTIENTSTGGMLAFDDAVASIPCPSVGITPQNITLQKTCDAPVSHEHNGVLGQKWMCRVEVSVPSAPFAGDIILHDVFTDTTLVDGEILLGESTSGNGSCFQGDCIINGANFDSSGTEYFDFDVYIEATGTADVFALENCVAGEIDDGSGTLQPLTPNCATGQWIPRSEVVKTCDPIPENAVAPYTLNCQIEVTASGLVAGTFVTVMDAFAAQPPSVATVIPTFMNVTSTENWDCIDHQINAPSAIGFCELPAEDLVAAGGTSTLHMSFQFDVDQTPTQVANCRFTDIHDGSYLAKLSGLRSAVRSPIQNDTEQANGWPQMPDGCVYVDVPAPQLETKVRPQIQKKCDQPHLSTQNGIFGYLWQCEAEINVTPSPFAGTVSFVDDGSQISMGTASFVSVSDPTNCQGLQTDTLACSYAGNTFASPHHVQYDLFTPYVATNEEITWKNCIHGEAVTPAGTFPSVPMCTGRIIKPTDLEVLPPLKDVKINKTCGEGRETEFDGQTGLGWDCEITVTASPVPFSGTFSFTENASTITGSTGQIIGIGQATPADWSCTPNVPTQTTECSISGANFDASGVETLGFTLFAPDRGEDIKWQNCVSGLYRPKDGEPHEIKGNCEDITWTPTTTPSEPEFTLKKGCRGPFAYQDMQRYVCTIHVSQTAGDPISQALTLEELFSSTTTGQLATQYLAALQGSAGWVCDTSSASCTIAPNDFNGVTGHQISGVFLIPNGTLQEQDFENCAALNMGDQQVATAPCVAIDEPAQDPELTVEKECKPIGERMELSDTAWFQQWQCTLTVTSNGVPFTDPIWIDENMLYGTNDGSASIVSMTSNDPWQCTQPVYGPGNAAYCGMDPTQFPYAAGQSTLNVILNLSGAAADQFGAENCVAISTGKVPSDDPADVIAQDCFQIMPTPDPKAPEIDLIKICEPAVQGADGQWNVACTLTITGGNLPAGVPLRVTDELMSSGTQTALFGHMNAPTIACGGGLITGGAMTACDLTTDDINAAGGTLTIPYNGTFQGPAGRPINGPQAQNCAYVDVPNLGLHGPQTNNGKSCVPIEFALSATTGPDIGLPANPTVPSRPTDVIGGIATVPNLPTPTPMVPSIEKTCAPLVFEGGTRVATAQCDITVTIPQGAPIQIFKLSDITSVPNNDHNIAQVANPELTGGANLGCAVVTSGYGIPFSDCTGTGVSAMASGGVFDYQWTAQIGYPPADRVDYQNCAYLGYIDANGAIQSLESCHMFEIKDEKSAETPAPSVPALEPSLRLIKTQTSDCVANRNTQRYTCGFRLSVMNEGSAPFTGPMIVTDTFGTPEARSMTLQSSGGWSCSQPVAGAISCEHAGMTLAAGAFAPIDMSMQVQGVVNGGQFNNCGAVGVPVNRAQRVAAIQQALNTRGYNAGPVDGKAGNKTFAALALLQKSLGLPVTRDFDDGLFDALRLPLAKPGEQSCVLADLPPMPKPPVQCERATTIQKGDSCQCRFDNMLRRNATSCQCKGGYAFVAGEGCIKQVVSEPVPAPVPEELVCDRRSTRSRGGSCVCIDQKNAVKTSSATCGCKNGGPMIGGKCLSISITPRVDTPDATDDVIDTKPTKKCTLRLNGICIK